MSKIIRAFRAANHLLTAPQESLTPRAQKAQIWAQASAYAGVLTMVTSAISASLGAPELIPVLAGATWTCVPIISVGSILEEARMRNTTARPPTVIPSGAYADLNL